MCHDDDEGDNFNERKQRGVGSARGGRRRVSYDILGHEVVMMNDE